MSWWWLLVPVGLLVLLAGLALRRLGYGRWTCRYFLDRSRRRPPPTGQEIHVLLCICDHFEPKAGGASKEQGQARVDHWVATYPRTLGAFRDSDGRPPRYTFFFPEEEYEPEYLDGLAQLCRAGFAEVEAHLHHDRDTAAGFRQKLLRLKDLFAQRHGLLGRQRDAGAVRYAFIHGNWALCNPWKNGWLCGVNEEIAILLETGCYADFTFPCVPDPPQPAWINRMYYAADRPGQRSSHLTGWELGREKPLDPSLLLIQGPLLLDWRRRKFGLIPRVENACLQASQPPSMARLERWLRARIQVPSRPDWFFVKLHAHGAPEDAHEVLLGEPMIRFHRDLAERAQREPTFHYHYVTAREMYNLAKAAEAGFTGSVAEARDYLLVLKEGLG